jgi:glycolate oxidase iron-sulfur subunit
MNGSPQGLGIDPDELASCVSCGLCLPHCPTFRVTGDEARSPRGRITAMRAVQIGGAPTDDDFVASMETCVQCRGCETACPSGVPFGRMIEATRSTLASPGGAARPPWWQRAALAVLGHRRLLLAGSTLLAVGQRLRLVPSRRLGLPARLPLRRPAVLPTRTSAAGGERGDTVWLFTGCVMDAWQRDVHVAVARVVEAAGGRVVLPGPEAACCGALHEHSGLSREAHRLASRTMAAFPGDAPIVVDSAGCGAMLRDYGRILGTDAARAFSARVVDVHTWLAERVDRLPPAAPGWSRPRVAVQDPCHLRHVQRAHLATRTVLAPYVDVVELDDDGLCCGAGGAYSLLQPALAGDIRARKVDAIARTGAPLVASANPGCSMHLAAVGVDVRHPVQFIEEAIGGR